ncbi:cupin domain-containing protein [Pleomorphomonas diazotrophica]|uniref:Cupin domain-containing protein n=1 Tax=Pleomorphomonas diazotrophica TaxID=1166257 RepID=A0A1I4Q551_9HYPH|nr:cupin domain-containing protein [Pleomorphomonas diazotrophica]PKR90938.1 cupin domain-containing protein [Pleomorphomonas diazotrophica]SFM34986.1 Cupin domain-containing protein [Pleomorphomonas diazotrophica]
MKFETFDLATVSADDRMAKKLRLFNPNGKGPRGGHVLGQELGTEVTILAYGNDSPGDGPVMHVHPYDEVFVILEGRARFYVGDQVIDAEAGDVVLGPHGLPHRFENLGPGRLQTLDVHHFKRWCQVNV